MCVDVDECAQPNACSYPYSCENTIGGYNCYCGPGYNEYNDPEEQICTDTDECWEAERGYGPSVCPDNSTCINTDGSYECYCNEGFTMVNGSCQSCSICPSSQQSQQETSTTIRMHVDATSMPLTSKSLPERQSPSLTTNAPVMGATSVPLSSPEASNVYTATEIIAGVIVSVIVLILMMLALISIYICVRRGGCVRAAWRKKHPYVALSNVQQQPLPEAGVVTSNDSVKKTEQTSPFKTITFTFQSPPLNSVSD